MKRGIFVLVLIIITCMSSIVSADFFEMNLTRNKVAAGQTFDGVLRFNFSKPVDVNTNIIFNVDGTTYTRRIEDIYDHLGITNFLPSGYVKNSNPVSQADISFNSQGSKVISAIDFSRSSSISSFNKFGISFNGEAVSGSFPTLNFDVGNDGVVDYVYKGQAIGTYEAMDSSYLGDGSADQSKIIRGNNRDVYCEKISLKPSDLFRINAKINKLANAADLVLNASIKSFEDNIASFNDCSVDKCCTMVQSSNSFSCDLNYEVNEYGNYSVCVSAFGGDSNTNYFSLAAHSGSSEVRGYHNGDLSNVDNFITTSRMLYNYRISSSVSKNIDPSILEEYVSSAECNGSCLVPLNISSDYAGKVKLSNLDVEFEDNSGLSSINSFTPIIAYGIRANYSGTLEIPLNFFDNVIAPSGISTGHRVSASIILDGNTLSTSQIQFDTVQGPPMSIVYSTNKPGVGESVYFSTRLRQGYNKSIASYNWNFGDGNISSVQNPIYSFKDMKVYSVSLTVVDSDGNVGKDITSIDVRPIDEIISNRISSAFSTLSSAKSSIDSSSAQVKDTAQILGVPDQLSKAVSDLTTLNNSVNKIFNNFTGIERTTKLTPLYSQLVSIMNSVPVSISQDVITFPSTVSGVNEIPDNIGSSDAERNSIFSAQDSVVVNGEARKVRIAYNNENNNEDFVLIKKEISSGDGIVYEIIPSSLSKKDIIFPKQGYEVLSLNVIKFGEVKSFIYTINEADIDSAVNSRTIVVPNDLKIVESTPMVSRPITVPIRASSPIFLISLVTIFIIGLIVYFGLFFKGGLFNKKSARKLFKDEKEYNAVRSFIVNALAKGAKNEDIKKALKSKGWKDIQVDAVINEILGSKKKS